MCKKTQDPETDIFHCFTAGLFCDAHHCCHTCCWLSHSYEFYCKISPPNVCEGQIMIKSVPLRGGNPEATSKLVLVTNTWRLRLNYASLRTVLQSKGFSFLFVLMAKSYRQKMNYTVMSLLLCDSFPATREKLYLTLWMCGESCEKARFTCGRGCVLTAKSLMKVKPRL